MLRGIKHDMKSLDIIAALNITNLKLKYGLTGKPEHI